MAGASGTAAGSGAGGGAGTTPSFAGEGGGAGIELVPVWRNVTSNLADKNIACGGVTYISPKPDENLLIVGLSEAGLWASRDGGGTWATLGEGAHSDLIGNRPSSIIYDPDNTARFWESGIYQPGGAYRTDDSGATFHVLGNVFHNDLLSIDFSDAKRRTILAGGHEQMQTLWRTTDAGDTWEQIGTNLPDTCHWSSFPVIIDKSTYLMGCGNGILRSTDAGDSWDLVSSIGGASAPLIAADGTIYWPDQAGGIEASTNGGEDWSRAIGGGVLLPLKPVELPDGRLASVGTQYVMVSADGGISWNPVTAKLPWAPSGLAYSVQERAFFIWEANCDVRIPMDAIQRSEFDFELQ